MLEGYKVRYFDASESANYTHNPAEPVCLFYRHDYLIEKYPVPLQVEHCPSKSTLVKWFWSWQVLTSSGLATFGMLMLMRFSMVGKRFLARP